MAGDIERRRRGGQSGGARRRPRGGFALAESGGLRTPA
jgi:hypothetical protein